MAIKDIQYPVEYLQEMLQLRKDINDGKRCWAEAVGIRAKYNLPQVAMKTIKGRTFLLDEYMQMGWINPPVGTKIPQSTTSLNADGSRGSEKVIELSEDELNSKEALLKAHGFNPINWELISARNSKWQMGDGSGGLKNLYSSKITVKPTETGIDVDELTKFFNNFNSFKYKGIKVTPKQYDENGEFLEIDLADLHVGLLSYGAETGEDYDVKIARERLERAMSDIYERCKGRKFKRIVLSLLGDIMHVDNQNNTTTKGTRQDVDTRVSKMFDSALDMLINVIYSLGNIAPVDVICVSGNHSQTLDYCLYKALEMCYRTDKNINFFNSPNPRKWRRYGKVLIGWGHGDMKPANATEWLQSEAYEDWGKSQFREVHFGHLHSEQGMKKFIDSISGLVTRYQPTLVASSAWEHSQGYSKNPKTLMSYVWNEDKGLREIWYSNI